MEARVASVLNGIARSMAPSGLKKALSFRVVELALRDDAVRSYPPARGQQWTLQKCLVPKLVEQLVEVLKERYQGGIQQPTAKRVVEVPKISCQEYVEALEGVPQERISEENYEVHNIAHPEQILEKDSAQIGVPRERVQQRSAEKEILENIRELSPGAHLGAYTDRRWASAADCERDPPEWC